MFPTALTVGPLQANLPTETIQVQDTPGGAWRTVTGVFVDRIAPQEIFGANEGMRPVIEIVIPTDAVKGVAGNFDRGETTFCVGLRIGDVADPTVAANLFHQAKIIESDEGMMELRLQ
jgi:hypothetical protein